MQSHAVGMAAATLSACDSRCTLPQPWPPRQLSTPAALSGTEIARVCRSPPVVGAVPGTLGMTEQCFHRDRTAGVPYVAPVLSTHRTDPRQAAGARALGVMVAERTALTRRQRVTRAVDRGGGVPAPPEWIAVQAA